MPVFCVSSRAYQKLRGRLQKDPAPPGFTHVDETEVPALQAHCIQLTTAGRQAACRKFLTSMFQLLNSLRLWAANDGSSRFLTEAQVKRESQILKERLGKLDSVSCPPLLVTHAVHICPRCSALANCSRRPLRKWLPASSMGSPKNFKTKCTTSIQLPPRPRNPKQAALFASGGRLSITKIRQREVSVGQRTRLWSAVTVCLQMVGALIISTSS